MKAIFIPSNIIKKNFTKNILIVLCLLGLLLAQKAPNSTDSSTNNPDNDKENPNYQLMIVGDQGQFVYFKSLYDKVKPMQIPKRNKTDIVFNNTKYSTENRQCVVEINSPEKNITYNFTNLSDIEARKNGMKNFDDLISTNAFQSQLKHADGIIFLGDTIYPESKKMPDVVGKNATLYGQEKWNTRLQCAWNIFTKHLERIKLYDNEILDERLDILPGNHSNDVSFNKEAQIFSTIKKKKENSEFFEWDPLSKKAIKVSKEKDANPTSYFYVKKLTISPKENSPNKRKIVFVDFNTSPLVCLAWGKNEADYENPKVCGFDKYYINRWNYNQTTSYYFTLLDVVGNLDPNDWNVIRGHHPPSNYEDGDATFYWNTKINNNTYNLMDKFEERNVRIFIGSHIHGQSSMAIPFRNNTKIRKRNPAQVTAKVDGNYCNPNNLKAKSEQLLNVEKTCNQTEFEVDLNKENLMMVFINGNAGKKFDPISDGSRSEHGNLIWSKKSHLLIDGNEKDAFGYSFAEFSDNEMFVKFWEMANVKNKANITENDSVNVAKFRVTYRENVKIPTQNHTLGIIIAIVLILSALILLVLGVKFLLNKKEDNKRQVSAELKNQISDI